MSNFKNIFENLGGFNPYSEFHPMKPKELANIEKELGVRLPDSYRDFLLEVGAACFSNSLVLRMIDAAPGCGPEEREPFDVFFGAEGERGTGLLEIIRILTGRLPDNVIPIGRDLMGNYMCLAIKGERRGRIYYLNPDDGNFYLAAESFDDFLSRLEVYKEPGKKD